MMIHKAVLAAICLAVWHLGAATQDAPDRFTPVRGLCIAAPAPVRVGEFVEFVNQELAPRQINTLILMVEYNYQFQSHPEVRGDKALSKEDAKKLLAACKTHHIRIIPEIDLLGHQSEGSHLGALLRQYPEFDETPAVKMPDKYKWPNPDRLYCKSYCPLHPKVHEVVFALMDELCEVFESDTFHAGMDEVFYLGDQQCPRCAGHDRSQLFAGEVRAIHDHLREKGRRLWIWGDRLLDGTVTGLGEWEASCNDTFRAIDAIPKDVVICDWHYARPDPAAAYFAVKGFSVVTCPFRNPKSALQQARDMVQLRTGSAKPMQPRFMGIMDTVWAGADKFLDAWHQNPTDQSMEGNWQTFTALFDKVTAPTAAKPEGAAAPQLAAAAPAENAPPPTRALVLAETIPPHGPFVAAAREWLGYFATNHNFQFDYVENTKAINAAFPARYKVFIQLNYPPYGWPPEAMGAFRDYIEKGKGGWFGFHHAALLGEFDGTKMWPWFYDFMGGIRFKDYIPTFAAGNVLVEDRNHPCLKGVSASFHVVREEWYTFDRSPRPNVQVLASVDEHSYVPSSAKTMGDHPVIWTNPHVPARNIYIFMGHGPELFQNTNYTTIVSNAVLWAAGQEIK